MVDPKRVVPFKVGKEQYHLYAGNRAFRLIERELGIPLLDVLDRLNKLDINALTVVVWALLQQMHPDLALDDVDGVVDAVGYEQLSALLEQALEHALPSGDESGNAGKGNGTGTITQLPHLSPA